MTERPGAWQPLRPLAVGVLTLALAAAAGHAASKPSPVALVVNAQNDVTELTSAQLRKIYLGDETRWASGGKITILVLPAGDDARRLFFERLLKMSDDDYVRHWIAKVFQGEATSGPKTASSPASMAKLVTELPGAIGFMGAGDAAGGTLKILKIDGRMPGEQGYAFAP